MFVSSFRAGVALLAAALFLRMLGVFLLLPVAAPLVAALPDGSALVAGLVLGGYGLTQAALQIPIGLLADKYGKKPVMLCALAVFALGGLLAAAADSAAAMVGGRLLQGMGAVAAVTAAWLADIAPAGKRAPAMAAFGVVIALAFLLALFAAPIAAAEMDGISGVFALSGVFGVVAFLCVLLLPPPPVVRASADASDHTPLRAVLHNGTVRRTAAGAFLVHFALAVVFYIVPSTLPLPPAQHWQVYAPALLLAAAPAWWLIKRVEVHTAACLRAAVGLLCAGTLLLPAAAHLHWGIAALCIFLMGFVVLEAALPALTARGAPAHARASAMGVVMSCQFAGMFCGAATAGVAAQMGWAFASALVAALLAAVWGKGAAAFMQQQGAPAARPAAHPH